MSLPPTESHRPYVDGVDAVIPVPACGDPAFLLLLLQSYEPRTKSYFLLIVTNKIKKIGILFGIINKNMEF